MPSESPQNTSTSLIKKRHLFLLVAAYLIYTNREKIRTKAEYHLRPFIQAFAASKAFLTAFKTVSNDLSRYLMAVSDMDAATEKPHKQITAIANVHRQDSHQLGHQSVVSQEALLAPAPALAPAVPSNLNPPKSVKRLLKLLSTPEMLLVVRNIANGVTTAALQSQSFAVEPQYYRHQTADLTPSFETIRNSNYQKFNSKRPRNKQASKSSSSLRWGKSLTLSDFQQRTLRSNNNTENLKNTNPTLLWFLDILSTDNGKSLTKIVVSTAVREVLSTAFKEVSRHRALPSPSPSSSACFSSTRSESADLSSQKEHQSLQFQLQQIMTGPLAPIINQTICQAVSTATATAIPVLFHSIEVFQSPENSVFLHLPDAQSHSQLPHNTDTVSTNNLDELSHATMKRTVKLPPPPSIESMYALLTQDKVLLKDIVKIATFQIAKAYFDCQTSPNIHKPKDTTRQVSQPTHNIKSHSADTLLTPQLNQPQENDPHLAVISSISDSAKSFPLNASEMLSLSLNNALFVLKNEAAEKFHLLHHHAQKLWDGEYVMEPRWLFF